MASREATWREPTRRWLAAAIIAAVAMFGWLTWHAIDAVRTLEQLRESHARAALVHDSMLRLEAQLQRTVQLALATGDREWLERHAEAEARLRGVIKELGDAGTSQVEELQRALAALDQVSAIEARATSLLDQGRAREGFVLVTGTEYEAAIAALGTALRTFDDGYHGWLLGHSRGLTRRELLSLVGALSCSRSRLSPGCSWSGACSAKKRRSCSRWRAETVPRRGCAGCKRWNCWGNSPAAWRTTWTIP
jgi:cell division protein FtsB